MTVKSLPIVTPPKIGPTHCSRLEMRRLGGVTFRAKDDPSYFACFRMRSMG